MPYMYILKCNDDTYYTGSTKDLLKRIDLHQKGWGAEYTKDRLPVEVVYFEFFKYVSQAFLREKQVQGWSHDKKQALIESDVNRLHELSICQNSTRAKSVDTDGGCEHSYRD